MVVALGGTHVGAELLGQHLLAADRVTALRHSDGVLLLRLTGPATLGGAKLSIHAIQIG